MPVHTYPCIENECRTLWYSKTLSFFPVTVSVTEDDTDYYGNDVTGVLNGMNNKQPDAESCRSSCGSKGAKYFSWHSAGANQEGCWCKSSDSGRASQTGRVAGDVGSGEWDEDLKNVENTE